MSRVVSTMLVASSRQCCRQTATRKHHPFLHRCRPTIHVASYYHYDDDHHHHHGSYKYNQTIITRTFSSSSNDGSDNNPHKPKDYTKLQRLEDANPERIRAIQVNPESVGHSILPGNLVYKYYKRTGNTRKVPVELGHGYFWMMWDLQKTNNKPTLSNERLVPEHEAQIFPLLKGVKSLSGFKTDLPFFFIEGNDGSGKGVPKCTLVALSFRDFGYKFLSSWTEPFVNAFQDNDSAQAQVVKVSITERSSLYILQWLLTSIMRRNTPVEEHDKTLLYFGSSAIDEFRDVLRLHNLMTGYVFLLDDLGRIRFAGSGPASDEEVARVIGFAKELLPTTVATPSQRNNRFSHKGGGRRAGLSSGARTKRQRQ